MLSHKCGIRNATCVPVQLIRLQEPKTPEEKSRWEVVKRISNSNTHMYENYCGPIKLPSIVHKAKIGASKLSAWFSKNQKNNANEDTSWTTLYGRLERSGQLESPFFV